MGTSISSGRWVADYTNMRLYRDTSVTATVTDSTNTVYSDVQYLFDDAAQMDDDVPISAQTPTEYTIINQWFIDDESPKYLTGGAIQTSGYSSGTDHYIRAVEYTSTTPFGPTDIGKVLTGTTTTDTGTILAYDERYASNDGIVWLRVDDPTPGGDEFDQTEAYTVATSSAAGSVVDTNSGSFSQTGESLWANPYIVTTLDNTTRAYAIQDGVKVTDTEQSWPADIGFNSDGSIDVVLKVSEFGNLIDDGVTTWFARRGGTLYDHFEIDLSVGGRQPVPLSPGADGQNDAIGHYNMTWSGGSGTALAVGDIVSIDSDSEIAAIVADVTDSGATGDFDYFLIRGLSQLTSAAASAESPANKTMTLVTQTDLTPVTDEPSVTVTSGALTRDINNGNGSRPYSHDLNCNSLSWIRVYRALKFKTRRGSVIQIDGQDGEQYTGNAVQLEYGTQTGAFVEGEVVWGQTSGAFGTIVADHDDGATGDLILRDVRGTFTTEVVGDASSGPTDFATITSVRTIATPKTSPLGTYAGGTFFGAPGVVPVLASIGAGEANNYILVDDDGDTQSPPIQVSITVGSLAAGVRASVFRLLVAGGAIDKDEYASHNTNNTEGLGTFEVGSSIGSEVPSVDSWIRVEYSTDQEDRYHFSAYSGAIFTLTTNADWTGNTNTATDADGLVLTDTTTPATFISDGVLPGMMVQNTTDGSVGVVATVDSETVLTLEAQLSGGSGNDWAISDGYEINKLVRTYDNTANVYCPFIDDVATGTTLSRDIVYGGDVPVVVRTREGGVWLPFEVENTIDSGGMTQAAILTADTIAT